MKTERKNGGNVPNLRFANFKDEWRKSNLGSCSESIEYGMNAAACPYDGINKYIRITDIDENTSMYKSEIPVSPKGVLNDKYLVKENDILFARTGASTGKTYIYNSNDGKLYFAGFLIKARVKVDFNAQFIFYQTQTVSYSKWVKIMSMRSGQPGINAQEYGSFDFFIPIKQEQDKLASFLKKIDNRISTQNEIINNLESLKKGLCQNFFLQKIKFKDYQGKDFPNWKKRKLSAVLYEHKLKSTGKEEVHSVSVHKGVINQIEHLGRSFSAKNTDHYSKALPNDIIYTKSPTGEFPLGIIKQNHIKKDVIISPLYGVFTPESKELGYILHVYFESAINTSNYLRSIIQKGAKNTINITNNTFLSKGIVLPNSKEEQIKISKTLAHIDEKIEVEKKILEQYRNQKKYLLQNLFI